MRLPCLTHCFNRYVERKSCFPFNTEPGNQRDSSPRNQEKEIGCRDIWVATVAELCYIFLWSHVALIITIVAVVVPCDLESLVDSKARECQSISDLPMCQSLASDTWLLYLWSLLVNAWTEKKNYLQSQTGLSSICAEITLNDKRRWIVGTKESNLNSQRTVSPGTKRFCLIDYMLQMYWEPE